MLDPYAYAMGKFIDACFNDMADERITEEESERRQDEAQLCGTAQAIIKLGAKYGYIIKIPKGNQ